MAIRHVVTIQVAPGKTAEFAAAFRALQTVTLRETGCEQYELFQSLDDPQRVVMLERWTNQDLLDRHMAAEQRENRAAVDALIALWAAGTTPTVERYEY